MLTGGVLQLRNDVILHPSTRLAVYVAKLLMRREFDLLIARLSEIRDFIPTYDSQKNENLFRAVVAAEDIRFLAHPGFDIRGMCRAGVAFVCSRELQGASTIEQQLVRVIRRRYELTLRRKVSEILLATTLPAYFGKATILEMYMEVAYFGWHGTGIRKICQRLDLHPNQMSLNEAILIAALIKRPMPKVETKRYEARLDARISYIKGRFNKVGGTV